MEQAFRGDVSWRQEMTGRTSEEMGGRGAISVLLQPFEPGPSAAHSWVKRAEERIWGRAFEYPAVSLLHVVSTRSVPGEKKAYRSVPSVKHTCRADRFELR